MKGWERELYVSRIVAGCIPFTLDGKRYDFRQPSRDQRVYSYEVYREALREAELEGVTSQDELSALLHTHNLWTQDDQEKLDVLIKSIEDLKAELYESWNQSDKRRSLRNALKQCYVQRDKLESSKHTLDYLSCEGIAISAKYRYLMGCSIYHPDGSPYWPGHVGWDYADDVIDRATELIGRERLNESQFRELALNEPWRSYWGARKVSGRGVLDSAAVDMTDDQRTIVLWSTIFDSIRESPNCPIDEVFSDDEMLDGWMIIQRRKRESEIDKKLLDERSNSKILNSDEVFYMAQSPEDVAKIEKLNDGAAKMLKQQRMSLLKERKEVPEILMPDTALRLRTEATQKIAKGMRGQ